MTPILKARAASPARRWPVLGLALVVAGLAAVAAGCGGGVGSGGTGGFASGPITGFGSVIVNGVRFDDSTASVEDADGQRRSRDDLRLGMTAEVDSGAIASDGSGLVATASRIRFEAELVGPVASIDSAGGSFMLLGQRVSVDSSTVFDDSLAGGLSALGVGRRLAVYGAWDAAAERYRATRVEPDSGAGAARLRGLVAQLDAGAQTLRIGATVYGYAGAAGLPAGLAAGQVVRLQVVQATLPLRWVVQGFGATQRELPDGQEAKLKGLITALEPPQGGNSLTGLRVGGLPVDLSGAQVPAGRTALVLGARVEVEGRVQGGLLRATLVQLRSDQQEFERGFDLDGLILSVAPAQGTLVVRGVTISTARPDLRIDNGVLADLRVGRRVEVRGVLGSDRRTLEATRITLK